MSSEYDMPDPDGPEAAHVAADTDADEAADEALPAPPETGDERVDEAVAELAGIAGSPPAEHVAVYEQVHRRLQDTLADLDGS